MDTECFQYPVICYKSVKIVFLNEKVCRIYQSEFIGHK